MSTARFVTVVAMLLAVASAYTNKPITSMTDNAELTADGFSISRGGTTYKVSQGYGWCRDNAACNGTDTAAKASSLSSCYSKYYAADVPAYQHCSTVADNNSILYTNNFNLYNMTYEARVHLLDLDINGYSSIVTSATADVCQPNFHKLCYTVMWAHNIRAGFGCRQYGTNNVTFDGVPYQPPCQNYCYSVMNDPCTAYAPAVLRGIETIAQFCELFPTQNCMSSASILPLSAMFVALSVVAAVFGALL